MVPSARNPLRRAFDELLDLPRHVEDHHLEVDVVLSLARESGLGGLIIRDGGKTSKTSDNRTRHPLPWQRG